MRPNTKTYQIEGMTCSSCEARVLNALNASKDISNVDINLVAKEATVSFKNEVDDQVVVDAVASAGYRVNL